MGEVGVGIVYNSVLEYSCLGNRAERTQFVAYWMMEGQEWK